MNIENPHMLPKVRSEALRESCAMMPCTLRIGTFVGIPCAPKETVVGCHLPVFGKGTSTKVSDLYMAAGCHSCHDLLDYERNPIGAVIRERNPQAFWEQMFRAICETQGRWVKMGLIEVPGANILKG